MFDLSAVALAKVDVRIHSFHSLNSLIKVASSFISQVSSFEFQVSTTPNGIFTLFLPCQTRIIQHMMMKVYYKKLFSNVISIFLLSIVMGCEKLQNSAFRQKGGSTKSRMDVDEFFRMVADSNVQVIDHVRDSLDAGISPNMTDNEGCTPLIYAIAAGKTNIASFLIERGANIEHVTSAGETPLRVACASDENVWAVRLLVAKGANINDADAEDFTPLMMAAQWGFERTTEVLLELGADVSMTNRLGQTAAELAWMSGHQALAKKIIEPRPSVSTGTPPHALKNSIRSEIKGAKRR